LHEFFAEQRDSAERIGAIMSGLLRGAVFNRAFECLVYTRC
jgi:hypothetical protein